MNGNVNKCTGCMLYLVEDLAPKLDFVRWQDHWIHFGSGHEREYGNIEPDIYVKPITCHNVY